MSSHHPRSIALAFICTLVLVTGACDTLLEPFDDETGVYSIHGILTLSEDTHYVRIRDINQPVTSDSTPGLDATVTLQNLDEGTTDILTDSVVSFDGTYTHNFRVDTDIQPGDSYELTVERSDGETATARATMPPVTEVEVSAHEPIFCLTGPVFDFINVPDPRLVEISIGVPWNDSYRWVDRDVETQSGFLVWRVLEEALPRSVTAARDSNRYCTLLPDNKLLVAYTHYGPDWPADSTRLNPVKSNVHNGLGLFGGLHRDTLTVTVDTVRT